MKSLISSDFSTSTRALILSLFSLPSLTAIWVYTLRDYVTTFDFLKRANAIGLPMSELITDKFPLEQINEALQTNLAMTGLKIAVVNK